MKYVLFLALILSFGFSKESTNIFVKKETYPSGEIKFRKEYKDNLKHGKSEYFNEDGTLIDLSIFENDKMVKNTKYYDYGVIKSESNYKNEKLDGVQKTYHRSGSIFYESNYKKGKLHGEHKIYFKNGQLGKISNFVKSYENGNVKSYYQNGDIKQDYNYVYGKLEGSYKGYFKGGNLIEEFNYSNDKKTEEAKSYYKNGEIKEKFIFENDIPVSGYLYKNGKTFKYTTKTLRKLVFISMMGKTITGTKYHKMK